MLKIAKTPKDSKNKEDKKKKKRKQKIKIIKPTVEIATLKQTLYISSQIHRNTKYSSPNGVSCRKILTHNYCIISRNFHDPLIKIKTIDKSRKL